MQKQKFSQLLEKIHDSNILDGGYLHFDSLLQPDIAYTTSGIESENTIYFESRNIADNTDNLWVIPTDGMYSSRGLVRLSNNGIMLKNQTKKHSAILRILK